jgi:pimeloyl-ACP methyl ester carboxylesterase
MSFLSLAGSWISENESLLSGLAALIVVAGVMLSPLGAGLRRVGARRRKIELDAAVAREARDAAPAHPAPVPAAVDPTPGESQGVQRIRFKDLTAPSPYPTRFARSEGVRIAYNDRGDGPTTIVFAPGIISHLNLMENLPPFRNMLGQLAGFARVLAFDTRGQGLSDPTLAAPTLAERTRDIGAVMDAAGIERAVLLGFSEGGPMILQFAYENPERVQGLVLVGTTAAWLQSESFPVGLARPLLESLPRQWGRGTLRDVFFPSISRAELDDETYRSFERLIATRSAIEQLVEMMIETDVRPILPGIRTPALVVHFTGDLAVPIRLGRALAEALPDAEFVEVNAVDHGDLSQVPEVIERIRVFCDRVCGGEPLVH